MLRIKLVRTSNAGPSLLTVHWELTRLSWVKLIFISWLKNCTTNERKTAKHARLYCSLIFRSMPYIRGLNLNFCSFSTLIRATGINTKYVTVRYGVRRINFQQKKGLDFFFSRIEKLLTKQREEFHWRNFSSKKKNWILSSYRSTYNI